MRRSLMSLRGAQPSRLSASIGGGVKRKGGALTSERSPEADFRPRRFNVAEVPEADLRSTSVVR
jgi:hypothetical protein